MTQMSAETYIPGFQAREQNHAYDPNQKSRFDEFGHLRDDPTIEGFDASDFHATCARQTARMQALDRVAKQEAQARARKPSRVAQPLAYIRANREHLISQSLR